VYISNKQIIAHVVLVLAPVTTEEAWDFRDALNEAGVTEP
jgi:hypothetical protein